MNPKTTMSPETISTGGVSFLTNTYKQFANKSIQDCIKDGFPASFLRLPIHIGLSVGRYEFMVFV